MNQRRVAYVKVGRRTIKLEERSVRAGFVEDEAPDFFLRALPFYLRPLITTAFETGMWQGELQGLVWGDASVPEGLRATGWVYVRERGIRLEAGAIKNNQGRGVVMTETLCQTLRLQKDGRALNHPDCPWVFFRVDSQGDAVPVRDFRPDWVAACRRVGSEGLLFHDLRRSAIRRMVRAGVPEWVAMEISDHKTRSVFDRYNIVSDADLLEAARRLEHFKGSGGQFLGLKWTPNGL